MQDCRNRCWSRNSVGNVSNNTEENVTNSGKTRKEEKVRRGRKGRVYFTGVLNTPEGIKWLDEFENPGQEGRKNKEKESGIPSTVAVSTSQGSLVLENKVDESQNEVADPTDYVTVLQSVADQVFNPLEESPHFF